MMMMIAIVIGAYFGTAIETATSIETVIGTVIAETVLALARSWSAIDLVALKAGPRFSQSR
jgi:hypothetical protein